MLRLERLESRENPSGPTLVDPIDILGGNPTTTGSPANTAPPAPAPAPAPTNTPPSNVPPTDPTGPINP